MAFASNGLRDAFEWQGEVEGMFCTSASSDPLRAILLRGYFQQRRPAAAGQSRLCRNDAATGRQPLGDAVPEPGDPRQINRSAAIPHCAPPQFPWCSIPGWQSPEFAFLQPVEEPDVSVDLLDCQEAPPNL